MRWFLLGVYLAFLPPLAATVLTAYEPRFTPLLVISIASLGLIPIALLIAVVRYDLIDVDRLISATASYSMLGVLLLAGLMAAVPRLSYALGEPAGLTPATAQVLLSVMLAFGIVVLNRTVRPRVDRLLFAEHHALEESFGQLLVALTGCANAEQLIKLCGQRLDALLRPESCVIYGRAGETFSPVFVRGRAIPPAFAERSPLAAALDARATPLAAERVTGGHGPALGAFERAALETLGVPLIVPVHRGGELVAFVCLGPKRSGDVYTSTDLVLLAAVAEKLSSELLRFDQDEVLRQSRAMQEALRRYVPGAVAEEVERGTALDLGERELSILFVDIRGYSSYAEGRPAGDTFSAVNRYTRAVSQVVREHGGTVVEFNGDGMMAVFGAPRPLPDKERAALDSARAIVAAVATVGEPGEPPIAVGCGIATGAAFVGNVRAVDRWIWTAIGATTNLAARLQALTRELEAAVVVDTPTWERAGTAGRGFERRDQVAIRGRRERVDVHVLPLSAGG
jgi:class 3 adenylate cyclase